MNKVVPKREIGEHSTEDSVKSRIRQEGDKYNKSLFERCMDIYASEQKWRHTRARNYRYVYTDQWGDWVQDENGHWVKERDRISKRTGGIVLQNNHLFKIVNSLVGIYAKSATMPICFARQADADQKSQMMTNALQTNWDRNEMKDLMMEFRKEMIIGGLTVSREEWGIHEGIEDAYTYIVDPSKVIMERGNSDPRFWDLSLIGEIQDWTLGGLAARLVSSGYDYYQLEQIYRPYLNEIGARTAMNTSAWENESWDNPPIETPCRTWTIWTLEHKPRYRCKDVTDVKDPLYRIDVEDLPAVKAINQQRILQAQQAGLPMDKVKLIEYERITDQYWHCQILGPEGIILDEYDSPYDHKSHPYTIQAYNWVNGDVVPFISVVIDQQRYINRLISLHDMAISASVKGIKMIPKSVVPKGMSEKQFAKQFIEIDRFIFYEPDPSGAKPEVISQNSINIGTADLLKLEIGFMSDITNVSEALRGQSPNSGTSATRYMVESENSSTSLAGMNRKFNTFETAVARKKMKVIHQYYTEPKNISTLRSGGYSYYETYRPTEVQDIDFDCKIAETNETPLGRMMINELLEQLESIQAITPLDRLKYGYYPGTEGLKQELESRQEQQGQMAAAAQQAPMDQQAQQANPGTVSMLKQVLNNSSMMQ